MTTSEQPAAGSLSSEDAPAGSVQRGPRALAAPQWM